MLPQQLQAGVGEVAAALALPGLVGSAAGQLTGALVSALRERQARAQALAGAARTAALLEATPDLEALSYYPHLMAWDLARLPAKKAITPVVLLDTFEDTSDRHRDFERLLQRLVWLMPNAFFVIGGRSRLPWADPALHGQLDWTGPAAWPGLATDSASLTVPQPRAAGSGARQYLIGDLSPRTARPTSPAAWSRTASPSSTPTSAPRSPPAPTACPCTWTSRSAGSWRSAAPAAPPPPPTSTAPSRPSSRAPSPTSPPRNGTCCAPSRCWTPSTSTSPPRQPASPTRPPPGAWPNGP